MCVCVSGSKITCYMLNVTRRMSYLSISLKGPMHKVLWKNVNYNMSNFCIESRLTTILCLLRCKIWPRGFLF